MIMAISIVACGAANRVVGQSVSASEAVLEVVSSGNLDHDSLIYMGRIEAALLASGLGSSPSALEERLDALWEARYTSEGGGPGWGLPYSWDAFRDGTTNPVDTIYTYTTAMAALAFLDGYIAQGRTVYLERAKAAVNTILEDCWGFEEGMHKSVWYSDQRQDQVGKDYVVHNVNALTLAALSRITRYEARTYAPEKTAGIEAMLVDHAGYEGVEGQWQYQIGGPNRNDLVHHAYIALGLVEAGLPEAETALRYMWMEWFDDLTGAFDTTNREVMGSTSWGPGDALLPLTAAEDWQSQARLLTEQIVTTVDGDGVPTVADLKQPRSMVRYGLGPALFAARAVGVKGLFP